MQEATGTVRHGTGTYADKAKTQASGLGMVAKTAKALDGAPTDGPDVQGKSPSAHALQDPAPSSALRPPCGPGTSPGADCLPAGEELVASNASFFTPPLQDAARSLCELGASQSGDAPSPLAGCSPIMEMEQLESLVEDAGYLDAADGDEEAGSAARLEPGVLPGAAGAADPPDGREAGSPGVSSEVEALVDSVWPGLQDVQTPASSGLPPPADAPSELVPPGAGVRQASTPDIAYALQASLLDGVRLRRELVQVEEQLRMSREAGQPSGRHLIWRRESDAASEAHSRGEEQLDPLLRCRSAGSAPSDKRRQLGDNGRRASRAEEVLLTARSGWEGTPSLEPGDQGPDPPLFPHEVSLVEYE